MARTAQTGEIGRVPRITAVSEVYAVVDIGGDGTALAERMIAQETLAGIRPLPRAVDLVADALNLALTSAGVDSTASAILRRVRATRFEA